MADTEFEPQAGEEIVKKETPAVSTIYPQELEIPFKFHILANSPEERDQWFDTGTNNVSVDAIADIFDVLTDEGFTILSINNLTRQQLQKIFSERE